MFELNLNKNFGLHISYASIPKEKRWINYIFLIDDIVDFFQVPGLICLLLSLTDFKLKNFKLKIKISTRL